MKIEELNKLEEKVKGLVNNLEILKHENRLLRTKLDELKNENTISNSEKDEIKKKVKSLIKLIDSIENEK